MFQKGGLRRKKWRNNRGGYDTKRNYELFCYALNFTKVQHKRIFICDAKIIQKEEQCTISVNYEPTLSGIYIYFIVYSSLPFA